MKFDNIRFREINIPLNFTFAQANNPLSQTSRSAIVELHTTSGIIGYGEACPRLYVTGEDMNSVKNDLINITGSLLRTPITSLEDIKTQLTQWGKEGMGASTICALELAYLDAWSKTIEKTLPEIFQIKIPKQLNYSLVLPLIKPKHFPVLLERIKSFTPTKIKLKANNELENNLERIKIIQDFFGSTIPIRVDVNGGWTYEEANQFIPKMMDQGVLSFEQPLAADTTDGWAALTQSFGKDARIMFDESLLNKQQATYAIEHQLCNHFNLKISKLGGIFRALEINQLATKNGIPSQLGAHFGETSLLSSAGILLAGLTGELTAIEGALGNFLLKEDITNKPIVQNHKGELDTTKLFKNDGWIENVQPNTLDRYEKKMLSA